MQEYSIVMLNEGLIGFILNYRMATEKIVKKYGRTRESLERQAAVYCRQLTAVQRDVRANDTISRGISESYLA